MWPRGPNELVTQRSNRLKWQQNTWRTDGGEEKLSDLIWRRLELLRPSWTRCSRRGGSRPGGAESPRCSPPWTAWFSWSPVDRKQTQKKLIYKKSWVTALCSRCSDEFLTSWFCFFWVETEILCESRRWSQSVFRRFGPMCWFGFGTTGSTSQSHQAQIFRTIKIFRNIYSRLSGSEEERQCSRRGFNVLMHETTGRFVKEDVRNIFQSYLWWQNLEAVSTYLWFSEEWTNSLNMNPFSSASLSLITVYP